jgi:3-oxoacyl-[acyl-carrier protein] reductase
MNEPAKNVIVTGAASGIGLAVTQHCLGAGYRVAACDIDRDGLERLRHGPSDQRLAVYQVDVGDYTQVESLFNQMADGPDPTDLVNNAGIYLGKSVLQYSVEEMSQVFQTNCMGPLYLSRKFAQLLLAKHRTGSIVNISSVSGQDGSSDAVYGMAKAAVIGLTRSCALNFAPHIRVNAVAPGLVSTDMLAAIPEARIKEYRNSELIKEPILPEDVAATVGFLLSDQSKHYTGAIFDLNNGQYRR